MKWICCQLGAREHYAIPRALSRLGILDYLVTDAWIPPSSILAKISAGNLADRFHNELRDARVMAFNSSAILFEMLARARRLAEWETITARNQWFQRKVVNALTSLAAGAAAKAADFRPPWRAVARRRRLTSDAPVLLSYSYTALEPFRYAKAQGWKTVLVQIDPGPVEEEIVAAEVEREPSLAPSWTRAPADYWKAWREECDAADRIIVNSQWSRSCLVRAGVNDSKLFVVPLAYESPITDTRRTREYPPHFTPDRPLRVLFLGQINLRKGIARLLKAARSFQSQPLEFLMAGPIQINVPEDLRSNRNIRWIGPVARNKVRNYYQQADVLILPTLSDGFALTQLEALAHRLPVIASRQCGDVITDHVNGLLLEEPTAAAIEEALRFCLHNPDWLAQFSENATIGERFSLSCLGARLCPLAV